jgi:hypothetical protein
MDWRPALPLLSCLLFFLCEWKIIQGYLCTCRWKVAEVPCVEMEERVELWYVLGKRGGNRRMIEPFYRSFQWLENRSREALEVQELWQDSGSLRGAQCFGVTVVLFGFGWELPTQYIISSLRFTVQSQMGGRGTFYILIIVKFTWWYSLWQVTVPWLGRIPNALHIKTIETLFTRKSILFIPIQTKLS